MNRNADMLYYGKWIAVILIASFALIGGWQWHQYSKNQQYEKASEGFQTLLEAIRDKNLDKAGTLASDLEKQYPGTNYAPLASLMLARLALENGKLDEASQYLRHAMETNQDSPISHFARVRLARVMMEEQKYKDALALLQSVKVPDSLSTLYDEAMGDIYLKLNEIEKAKEAYQSALKSAPHGVPTTSLQLKQSNLPSKETS